MHSNWVLVDTKKWRWILGPRYCFTQQLGFLPEMLNANLVSWASIFRWLWFSFHQRTMSFGCLKGFNRTLYQMPRNGAILYNWMYLFIPVRFLDLFTEIINQSLFHRIRKWPFKGASSNWTHHFVLYEIVKLWIEKMIQYLPCARMESKYFIYFNLPNQHCTHHFDPHFTQEETKV